MFSKKSPIFASNRHFLRQWIAKYCKIPSSLIVVYKLAVTTKYRISEIENPSFVGPRLSNIFRRNVRALLSQGSTQLVQFYCQNPSDINIQFPITIKSNATREKRLSAHSARNEAVATGLKLIFIASRFSIIFK